MRQKQPNWLPSYYDALYSFGSRHSSQPELGAVNLAVAQGARPLDPSRVYDIPSRCREWYSLCKCSLLTLPRPLADLLGPERANAVQTKAEHYTVLFA